MQTMYVWTRSATRLVEFPDPDVEVMPGIPWGHFDHCFTAAYWKGQAEQAQLVGLFSRLRLGDDLREETAACLLGGHGVRGEIGVAAFRRLRDRDLLVGAPGAEELERSLSEPIDVGGRLVRYRYPKQKAKYLSLSLAGLADLIEPDDDVVLRDTLATLPGVGLKTASWIVRNYRASNAVAVLDVHIVRACELLGLFAPGADPQRKYRELESEYLSFCAATGSPASIMDAIMWRNMRILSVCLRRDNARAVEHKAA